MAGALAIASITATLKHLLGNGLIASSQAAGVGDVSVSALPPDRITTGTEERNQLNLFMYRVASHTKLSTAPKTKRPGESRDELSSGRLALDLHYLVTAYGAQELQADILLGCAMQVLSETPVLSDQIIGQALGSALSKKAKGLLAPSQAALANADVVGQIEAIKVTPKFLSFEELSKLWSALQARCRPSIAYEVSAVVMNGIE